MRIGNHSFNTTPFEPKLMAKQIIVICCYGRNEFEKHVFKSDGGKPYLRPNEKKTCEYKIRKTSKNITRVALLSVSKETTSR